MKEFLVKTKIYNGSNILESEFKSLRRVFIVTDSFMADSNKVEYVTKQLDNVGAEYSIFSDIKGEPDLIAVQKGIRMLLSIRADAVIAFGGGSAIDAAKAILFLSKRITCLEGCCFIAIPTTSGTGTEVSKFSVITDAVLQKKYPLVSEEMIPDIAILDAQLIKSVPPIVTADTGADVFTHAVEAYVSLEANDFSDAVAIHAIRLVRRHLLRAYEYPDDVVAREGMHHASCLAGMAFSNAGLGLNHGMAHALGAQLHIPHGRANAILLPYVISYNSGCGHELTDTAKKYASIARILHLESSSIRQSVLNLIRMSQSYAKKMGVPSTIQAAVSLSQKEFLDALDGLSNAALQDSCTASNPKLITAEGIKTIFTKAWFGKLP